jgi:Ca2+/Na+ antiporter
MMLLLVLTGLCGLSVGACFGAVLMAILVMPKFDGLLLARTQESRFAAKRRFRAVE